LISANLKINYKMINKKERGESNFFCKSISRRRKSGPSRDNIPL
jgi:hypothetical protein